MSQSIIKFLGHTSMQVTLGKTVLVIDPNFSTRVILLRRQSAPHVVSDELTKTNAILVSNAHYNRLDLGSLKYFKQSTTQVVLPVGLSNLISRHYSFNITELKPNDQTQIGEIQVTGVKSLHHGGRIHCCSYTKCLNYILKWNNTTIFYCGDAPYNQKFFTDIAQEYAIDVAILPISHVAPDWSAKHRYMTPCQSLCAFKDLKAKKMVPNAYGAFNFANMPATNTLELFNAEVERLGIKDQICLLQPGESTVLS